MRTKAVTKAAKYMSLNKALGYCGMPRQAWHCTARPGNVPAGADAVRAVRRIAARRPTYGTRRMAAQVARETGVSTNRKKVQRTCRKMGYIQPQKTKNDIIRAGRGPFRPEAPNRLWGTDITYVWCGIDGWCYCFNVVDCLTRKWIAYALGVHAARGVAIDSITNAVAAEKPDCPRLRLRTDNGNQYTSRDFRRAVRALGIGRNFVS